MDNGMQEMFYHTLRALSRAISDGGYNAHLLTEVEARDHSEPPRRITIYICQEEVAERVAPHFNAAVSGDDYIEVDHATFGTPSGRWN